MTPGERPSADRYDPSKANVAVNDGDNLLLTYENLMVQVRRRTLDVAILNRIEATVRIWQRKHEGILGGVTIVLESAEIPAEEVRKRQKKVIGSLLEDADCYMAVVFEGGGLKTTMMRSISRLVSRRGDRVHFPPDRAEAASWLSSRIGRSAALIRAAVEDAVERATS